MKKRVIVIIFILIITIVFIYNFISTNYKKIIKDEIGIDVSSCKLTNKYNTKGSFGDGEYVVILDCGKSKTLKKQIKNWNKTPMDKKTINNIYGNDDEGYSTIGRIASNYNIPMIKKGYYVFYDQSPTTPYNLGDTAMNFICAIYDDKNQKLYYIEYDS